MKSIKYIIAVLTLFTAFSMTGSAQVPDDPILQTCEELADMNKRKDIEIAGLKAQAAIDKERLALEKERVVTVAEQRDFYKVAYEKSSKVDTNSGLIIENLRTQVNEYKIENVELRSENKSLRSSRTTRSIFAGLAGFGAGVYVGSKN